MQSSRLSDRRRAPLVLTLEDEAATAHLGAALGAVLEMGDVVTLYGGLGAGKSVLARAAIRSCLGDPALEVPSPTYTLVNVFERPEAPPVWHADLYRLGSQEEVAELGLEDAFEAAVCLVEWAGRLGPMTPPRRLEVTLSDLADGDWPARDGPSVVDGRRAELLTHGDGWERVLLALALEGARQ
ncbi:MAG: tRNA (adenosine(37)-N6)-threonylcarbamoyltransferase complex ATPase subunit type 1 TsaE [Pseudomonadota bacterium]